MSAGISPALFYFDEKWGAESMDGSMVAESISYTAKLNAKEKRLLAYLYDGGNPNIGAMCRGLGTTPFTLLGKTFPNLRKKLEPMGIEI